MQTQLSRFASAFTSLALTLGAAACGGGGGDSAPDLAIAAATDTERATALARRPPPPPIPPAPTTDATLALASASASGLATEGSVCGVSADGGKVAFTSGSGNLVSGDTQFGVDLFVKNFNGNGVTRVVTGSDFNPIACLALTPDANTVVYVAYVTTSGQISPGAANAELAILVRNLLTGVQTRVTPPRNTFANVEAYEFSGISDDGLRVAFVAQPFRSCSGYDCTAVGSARMLLRDLATGQLINLESQVRLSTTQGRVTSGTVGLSRDGKSIAFSTYTPYPELGDNNIKNDLFVLDIGGGSVRQVNTDEAGRPITFTGFGGEGPSFGVQDFLANNSKIAFRAEFDTDAGPGGIYVKNLTTGALTRVFGRLGNVNGARAQLSFSDDGRRLAYVQSTGGGVTYASVPTVVDLATGAELNVATLSTGKVGNGNTTVTALLSRDGKVAAFDNNATNLLGGVSPLGGAELRAYRKILP
jgi:Tol biopolymer transport system component